MQLKDLQVFDDMPFLFFVKDEEWKYRWVNRAFLALAGENVVGKRDHELVWSESAEALVAVDREVLNTGKTQYLREYISHPVHGKSSYNVCKFIGELDGRRMVFGIAFEIAE